MDLKEFKLQTDGARHPWELARFNVVRALLKKYLIKDQIVLDVGCGDGYVTGGLASVYNDNSFVALDSELDHSLMEKFKKQFPEDNIQFFKTMEDVETGVGDRKIAIVLLLDVLEHIEDEREFLDDLLNRSWISDNVFFLVTVPAFQFLFGSHDKFLGHYRRYSNRQTRNVLKSIGLVIMSSGYFFSSLLPFRFLQVLKEKIFCSKGDVNSRLVSWGGGEKKTVIIQRILYFDFLISRFFNLFGIKLPGLSNYVICQKPVS